MFEYITSINDTASGKPEFSPEVTHNVPGSLALPGRKQARKHVRDVRDFNNIETRAVIKCFFFSERQGAEGNSRQSDRNVGLFPSWLG